MVNSEILKIGQLFNQLIIYRSLKDDPLIVNLLHTGSKETSSPGPSLTAWFGGLLEQFPESANPWAFYLCELIKANENHFSLACERHSLKNLPPSIIAAVLADLKMLAEILKWEPAQHLPVSLKLESKMIMDTGFDALEKGDYTACLNWLAKWYATRGAGNFSKYTYFTWRPTTGEFKPSLFPEPFTFGNIIGHNRQKSVLTKNTEQFLQGFPANNILLYGESGLGKISLLKALGNRYAKEGLRLIEVGKENAADLILIMEMLQDRGLKFVIYIGNLMTEVGETWHRLKILFKKVFKVKPPHVLIYATMNNRHLLRDTLDEDDEEFFNINLLLEEIPLSDLFGITLTFNTPNQEEYLIITRGLALQKGLNISPDELDARAILWAGEHKGFSGWTAKQFIDQLEGELGFEAQNNQAKLDWQD
jgi:predicted AAA+ superfamily ATPase